MTELNTLPVDRELTPEELAMLQKKMEELAQEHQAPQNPGQSPQ